MPADPDRRIKIQILTRESRADLFTLRQYIIGRKPAFMRRFRQRHAVLIDQIDETGLAHLFGLRQDAHDPVERKLHSQNPRLLPVNKDRCRHEHGLRA